ncbi:hypothetical protein JCM10908_005420 [Rhodotorula pacifica]|uniref:tyrosine-protein phosphatase n=1 Tax=Rhodotorula pacifica TaxID=1495444 RepID=UPI0031742986
MASNGASSQQRPPTPGFLKPSRDSLVQILTTLQEREQLRRSLGQQSRFLAATKSRSGRDGPAREAANGGSDHDAGWFSVAVGTEPGNVNKNRYGDIIAYDRTRILPPATDGPPPYVNASLVREPDLGVEEELLPRRWWVAAQAPIASTVYDFLSLLLTPPTSPACAIPLPPISLVVQLTPLVEGRRAKCHPYFPDHEGETATVSSPGGHSASNVWIRLEKKEEREGARESLLYVGREGDQQGRRIVHLEYLGWRDHGVPESAPHLLRFIHRVHVTNARLASATGNDSSTEPPILIHCSAGVGRTGTFIAISSLLPLLALQAHGNLAVPKPPPDSEPSHPLAPYPIDELLHSDSSVASAARADSRDFVGATIDGLRDQRTTMAQTSEQVAWVYECLHEAWRAGLYAP